MKTQDLFDWAALLEQHITQFTDEWLILFADEDLLSDPNNEIPAACSHGPGTGCYRRLARGLGKARKATKTNDLLSDCLQRCPDGAAWLLGYFHLGTGEFVVAHSGKRLPEALRDRAQAMASKEV